MIVGVLQADELDEDVIQRYGSHFDMIRNLLQPLDTGLEFRKYQATQSQLPDSVDECDAYIIPGSKFSVYEEHDWIEQLKQFVVEVVQNNKKLIGICFGHQLIAHTLGGATEKFPGGWMVGVMTSHITLHQDWMQPARNYYSLVVTHQDQVTALPAGAELIAENEFCEISGFKLGDNIITFQGHPEFSNDYLKLIMERRRDAMGEQVYQRALPTADAATDRKMVGQWMVNFIKS